MSNPINSYIANDVKVYQDVYIRNSTVARGSLIADRSVLLDAEIGPFVHIDRNSYVQNSVFGFGSYVGKDSVIKFTTVGNYCNLSWQLSIGGSNHNYKAACMYTASWWKRIFNIGEGLEPIQMDDYTQIGSDVWIGSQANILRGVKIGHGAVVGAQSLVLEDVPPYSVVVGSPARIVKYRFDEETINRLLKIEWWSWPPELVRYSSCYLQGDLDEEKLHSLERIAQGYDAIG